MGRELPVMLEFAVWIVGLWLIANLVHTIFNVGKTTQSSGFFCLSDWFRKTKSESKTNDKE